MKMRFLKNIFRIFIGVAACMVACAGCSDENRNLELAKEARAQAPWTMPDDIFENYVVPATSVEEAQDDWRPLFREKFLPVVKDCKTPTAAAETLNLKMWDMLGVRYSPQRDKPDQSPFHSMRVGKASCTGLSILLIDACRAVGVPARFVGCRWKNKPGNHSWVEIWENGEWFHLGAGDCVRVNDAWFNADTAHADPEDPQFAIYAACAKPTGLTFPVAWRKGGVSKIPALNVTARYLKLAQPIPEGCSRVSLNLRSRIGERLAREIVVCDAASGKELARGNTHDNRFDLNDHLNFVFPQGARLSVSLAENPAVPIAEIVVPASEKVFEIALP